MTKLLKWAGRLVTHNWAWKLLSLVIAMAIWMLVASEPELSTFATARIEFKNLPGNLELASTPDTTILLELRGPSGELGGLGDGSRHPAVILDMTGMTAGEHTFPIGSGNVNVPRAVKIVRATPSQVRFDFDRPMVRQVPVTVRFAGEGRNGYHVTALAISEANRGKQYLSCLGFLAVTTMPALLTLACWLARRHAPVAAEPPPAGIDENLHSNDYDRPR